MNRLPGDETAAMAGGCGHEANGMLAWLANGTLHGEEAARAWDHVRGCALCAGELSALEEISQAIRRHGVPARRDGPVVAAPPRLRRRRLWLAAAALTLPVMGALYWVGTRPGAGADPDPAFVIDLGAGPVRATYAIPEIESPPPEGSVLVRLTVPAYPGARDAFVMYGPDGSTLGPERELSQRDEVGSYNVTLDATRLSTPGDYRIQVRSTTPSGAERLYDYLFRVTPAAHP